VDETGEVHEVRLPPGAPPASITAAVAISPTESIAVTASGRIFATDPEHDFGQIPAGTQLRAPVVSLALDRADTGDKAPTGYWLVAADGGVFTFGSARFAGSAASRPLNRPVVSLAPTSTGDGYWLVAEDGGVFTFGDATYRGSAAARKLRRPVVGIVPTSTGRGYRLVAADGGVFTYGDAGFFGSGAGSGLTYVAAVPTPTGHGYWLVDDKRQAHGFGDAS
jgi:hypothetical protein